MWDQAKKGHIVRFTNVDELPDEASVDRQLFRDVNCISHVSIPLSVGGTTIGVLSFNSSRVVEAWPDEYVERFRVLGDVIANALMRKRSDTALEQAFREIQALKAKLEAENVYLREQVKLSQHHEEIVGESRALREVLEQVEQVAKSDTTVLVQGETGTGKELVANAIHRLSRRSDRPLVKVNCAAIPPTLVESELFGRERGAFTGASTREIGRFEAAHRGTILLDEIGELPLEVQGKLLRVLQDGTFERLGSPRNIRVDVRVIASTNRDLLQAVRQGGFRPDLYYRLNVFRIAVPPLRERREDIPALIWWFVQKYAKKMDKRIDTIPRKTMLPFQQHEWPGNVRELMNTVERSVILTRGNVLEAALPDDVGSPATRTLVLEGVEREHVLKVLEMTGWRIRGKEGAAELLGVKPTTLESRMAKLGIRRPR
jgi:transcriptional regulator with GAF, ATPase, and Fis domain